MKNQGFLIQDTSVNHASKNSEFIDRNGDERGADMLQDATPFDTYEEAAAFIEKKGFGDWAQVVENPFQPVTYEIWEVKDGQNILSSNGAMRLAKNLTLEQAIVEIAAKAAYERYEDNTFEDGDLSFSVRHRSITIGIYDSNGEEL
jgi:hypothetical protein